MATDAQLKSWNQTLQELGPRQREVVSFLSMYGRMSAWQIAERAGRLVHAVRPRLTELKGLGLLREAGERYETMTQRHEAMWELVKPGQGQLELL